VLGARRADRHALIGGPAISEPIGVTTAGSQPANEADKVRMLRQLLEQRYLFKQFLDYASHTAMPELGLPKLPIDFFSWHSYYVHPTSYYGMVVPALRQALDAAGFDRATPLLDTEWNIAPVPPYAEGDLNATEVGAAFVATTLIAMHESRVDGQAFQMFVDPGTEGYHGGTFTRSGIPRANFNVFRLFSRLEGSQRATQTSDPWVKSIAYADHGNLYLLVSTFVPTPKMFATTLKIRSALDHGRFTQSLADAHLAESLLNGKPLPEPFAQQAGEIDETKRQRTQAYEKKAAGWGKGLIVDIDLSGLPRRPRTVTRYLIDSRHSNIHPDLAKAEATLQAWARKEKEGLDARILKRLQEMGVSAADIEHLRAEMRRTGSVDEALSVIPPGQRVAARGAFEQSLREYRDEYERRLRDIANGPSARLYEESLAWPASGRLKLKVEPYSVQLFVFRRS
jgi:hypothetical protein